MTFSLFLKQLKHRRGIKSSKDHYNTLGGEEDLKISLRHFQDIESGKHPPSEEVFVKVFNQLESLYKKDCLLSYLTSKLQDVNDASSVVEFIDSSVKLTIPSEKKDYWDSKLDQYKEYTKEQLTFLSSFDDALRLHKRLLLYDNERVSIESIKIEKSILQKMKELKLIKTDGKYISVNSSYSRVPRFESSTPSTLSSATNFILENINAFIAKEGSETQGLFYASQLMDRDAATKVISTQENIKGEIHALASDKPTENCVPFVFVSFCKILDKKELGIYEK